MSNLYPKLKGRIVEVCGSQTEFAKNVGISHSSLSAKMNNRVRWSMDDIRKAVEVLGLTNDDIPSYFFCEMSSKV